MECPIITSYRNVVPIDSDQLFTVSLDVFAQPPTVTFVGYMGMQSVDELCREVDLVERYYRSREVRIRISSHGGDFTSLELFLERLGRWKEEKSMRVRTHALQRAVGPAAFMCAMGDIGTRVCHSFTQLDYSPTGDDFQRGVGFLQDVPTVRIPAREETYRGVLRTVSHHVFRNMVKPTLEKGDSRATRRLALFVEKINSLEPAREIQSGNDSPRTRVQDGAGISETDIFTAYNRLCGGDACITPELAGEILLMDHIARPLESEGSVHHE
ncbi:MAG: hypothetical protein RDU20_15190 [Desulfomonilaceae bacterium]|nr:hypothetical protein [Desulfomonilaceae bacterium]